MKPEYKARWIEALQSGKYEKGAGALRRFDNTFCCLGVLCDLVKEELKVEWTLVEKNPRFRSEHSRYMLGNDEEWLPKEVSDLVELDLGIAPTLAMMNDNRDYPITFKDIANYIEEKL